MSYKRRIISALIFVCFFVHFVPGMPIREQENRTRVESITFPQFSNETDAMPEQPTTTEDTNIFDKVGHFFKNLVSRDAPKGIRTTFIQDKVSNIESSTNVWDTEIRKLESVLEYMKENLGSKSNKNKSPALLAAEENNRDLTTKPNPAEVDSSQPDSMAKIATDSEDTTGLKINSMDEETSVSELGTKVPESQTDGPITNSENDLTSIALEAKSTVDELKPNVIPLGFPNLGEMATKADQKLEATSNDKLPMSEIVSAESQTSQPMISQVMQITKERKQQKFEEIDEKEQTNFDTPMSKNASLTAQTATNLVEEGPMLDLNEAADSDTAANANGISNDAKDDGTEISTKQTIGGKLRIIVTSKPASSKVSTDSSLLFNENLPDENIKEMKGKMSTPQNDGTNSEKIAPLTKLEKSKLIGEADDTNINKVPESITSPDKASSNNTSVETAGSRAKKENPSTVSMKNAGDHKDTLRLVRTLRIKFGLAQNDNLSTEEAQLVGLKPLEDFPPTEMDPEPEGQLAEKETVLKVFEMKVPPITVAKPAEFQSEGILKPKADEEVTTPSIEEIPHLKSVIVHAKIHGTKLPSSFQESENRLDVRKSTNTPRPLQ